MSNLTVWMIKERTWGTVIRLGAFSSCVRYSVDGIEYQAEVENDDFNFLEDIGIDWEQDVE